MLYFLHIVNLPISYEESFNKQFKKKNAPRLKINYINNQSSSPDLEAMKFYMFFFSLISLYGAIDRIFWLLNLLCNM